MKYVHENVRRMSRVYVYKWIEFYVLIDCDPCVHIFYEIQQRIEPGRLGMVRCENNNVFIGDGDVYDLNDLCDVQCAYNLSLHKLQNKTKSRT